MCRGGMHGKRRVPRTRECGRARGIDQPVARTGKQQKRHGRRRGRGTKARRGEQLAQGVRARRRPLGRVGCERRRERGRRGPGCETQDRRLARERITGEQQQAQQRRVIRGTQSLPRRAERRQARIDEHAARDLGLSRQALYRRMEKLGIKAEADGPAPQV